MFINFRLKSHGVDTSLFPVDKSYYCLSFFRIFLSFLTNLICLNLLFLIFQLECGWKGNYLWLLFGSNLFILMIFFFQDKTEQEFYLTCGLFVFLTFMSVECHLLIDMIISYQYEASQWFMFYCSYCRKKYIILAS